MIIKKLKLHNWKNFQNVEVNLTERNFIIGPNAAGKSNLLDALRFLRDIAKQSGGLQTAIEQRGGIKKIRCLSARTKSNISIEVHLGESDEENAMWSYELDFMHTGGGVIKNQAKIIKERVFSFSQNKWILDRSDNKSEDSETLKYTHLEQITANKNFRDVQIFFQNIEYLNVIPQMVRDSSSYNQSINKEDFYGRNFLEKISKLNDRTKTSYFKKINEFIKLAVPQLEELKFSKDEMGIPHLEARYIHWRAKGSKQTEEQFSDGTLRLIGFLWALIENRGLILLEEPEINLHSEIIRQFPEFIAKIQRSKKGARQVIITTHSYDILSSPGIGTEEVLVLQNTTEGTLINKVEELDSIKAIIDAGFSMAEATIPFTAPDRIQEMNQLNLFE